jgi:hypothetical protein
MNAGFSRRFAPCRSVVIQKLALGPTKPIGCIGL